MSNVKKGKRTPPIISYGKQQATHRVHHKIQESIITISRVHTNSSLFIISILFNARTPRPVRAQVFLTHALCLLPWDNIPDLKQHALFVMHLSYDSKKSCITAILVHRCAHILYMVTRSRITSKHAERSRGPAMYRATRTLSHP